MAEHGTTTRYCRGGCRCGLCSEAQATQRVLWYQEHKDEQNERKRVLRAKRTVFLDAIKLAEGCTDCGYSEVARTMEFDHLPQHEKLFNVTAGRDGNITRLMNEIDKCEVVCKPCHGIRTNDRRAA